MQVYNSDIVFIIPGNSKNIYQSLSKKYSAIEPPTWALLLAQSCRSKNFSVNLIDANAENLTNEEVLNRVKQSNPRLLCFVVYGQNVNAGTTNMSGATELSTYLKSKSDKTTIVYIGSHVQALPVETLNNEPNIDIVCTNEGVYSLHNLLNLNDYSEKELENIKGICFRVNNKPFMTLPEKIVPQERMDIDLPGYAWDLLPYKNKPFDLYRSPMWHAEYVEENRTPYAALQTSLGCRFGCNFCMINLINRNDNEEIGVASKYSNMRYWSPEFIIKEFDKLISMGVKTIRIVDEMFLLNPKYYIPLCELLAKRNTNDDLRMWAYSRVDTIKRDGILSLIRKAGIKWLCLGIESARKSIRLEISKGKFEDVDIKYIINKVHQAKIEVMANYIFGLPGEDYESIKKTYDLSLELNTLGWNAYAAMALPGSELYKEALKKNLKLPDSYSGYSFHSYDTQPLPTNYLKASEILKFRDEAFLNYHSSKNFLNKIKKKFGDKAEKNINDMTKIKIKRKIIEEESSRQK